MGYKRILAAGLCCGVLCCACASTQDASPPEQPRTTTLQRLYDGERITLEDLQATRQSALACARTITLLDRELREPWLENRDARVLLEHLRRKDSVSMAMAATAWETSEPCARGSDRGAFGEFGIFGARRSPGLLVARPRIGSIQEYAELCLQSQREENDQTRVLAGWRHLAPELVDRGPQYLASNWRFTVGQDTELELSDSLLGPFARCHVRKTGALSGMGPLDSLDGYEMPREILDLVAPDVRGVIRPLVDALAGNQGLPAQFRLVAGRSEKAGKDESTFLLAALRGLREGAGDVEYLPAGTSSFSVVVSYLLDTSEARAGLTLQRQGRNTWQIDTFFYEPAAASMLGQRGARLDLLPLLRSRQGT